jgi:hypothetical protein
VNLFWALERMVACSPRSTIEVSGGKAGRAALALF